MFKSTLQVVLPVCLALCCAAISARAADSAAVQFNRDILPILSDNCFQCHGPDEKRREAGLRLDLEASAKEIKEGKGAVIPGKSGESELVRRIFSGDADAVMPPPTSQRKLTAQQKQLLRKWIDGGAEWGGHWAFQELTVPPVQIPKLFSAKSNGPIDGMLFSRLERENLAPSPEAPRHTLIRRASLDLTGVPPMPEEGDAFSQDQSPDAYERFIDRLLASPDFGERMSWEWLEAARYADSNGYQGDGERTMWPWRDWVVSAFNRGLPYDQFTLWQLAGDQLPNGGAEQKLATGFCRNHMINGEGGRIAAENRIDYVLDMTETTGTIWLGLTFNCCRCHDHKFDALSKRDYYRLFAFFNQTPVDGGGGNPQSPPAMDVPTVEMTERLARLEETMESTSKDLADFETALFPRVANQNAADSPAAAKLPDGIQAVLRIAIPQRNKDQLVQLEKHWEKENADYVLKLRNLRTAMEDRENVRNGIPRVMVMEDMPTPRKTFMLDKGLYDKPQEEVTAATPASLPPLAAGPLNQDEVAPPNRLALAAWLVSKDQPLTPRVVVNRFWQQFFGMGLVKTPEDFGVQGARPTHPELLDWLAADFRSSGWDTKRLIRRLVTSAAYRQSSQGSVALTEQDPDNRLLARGPRYRLPAWMIRDRALAVSGLLVRRVGGPPVRTYQPNGVWEEATFGTKRYQQDRGSALYRRSVYVFWRRIVAPTMFFDSASRQFCTVKQSRTNTPLHSLATLNDITYVEASRALAERAMLHSAKQDERLNHTYRLVLSRVPTANEREILLKSLSQFQADYQANPAAADKLLNVGEHSRNMNLAAIDHAAWTALCNAILNLDEALVKE
jgi:Protein of unknown function (DUF1553)/Protein of unknown function (DUF1549)/Planctomycete cytochrome C